jgi:hypothetical protein
MRRVVSTWLLAAACGGTSSGASSQAMPTASSQAAPVVAPSVAGPPVPRVQTHDAWLDLVDQRPSAVVTREGRMIIDFGTLAARKHLALTQPGAWRLGEPVEERRAGIATGRTVAFDLPLDGELSPGLHPDVDGHAGLAMAITLRSLVPGQNITVTLNERVLAHLAVSSVWERRTFSLPADAIHHGDNRVRIHFRRTPTDPAIPGAAAIELVEVGTHADITATPKAAAAPAFSTVTGPSGRRTLELAAGTGLAYYVQPPRRARLEIEAAGSGVLEVLVSTTDDHRAGRPPTVASREPLKDTGERRTIDLGAWSGIPARIEIRVRGDRTSDARVTLTAADITVKRERPFDRRERSPRDVIVLAIESARADEVELGGRPPLPEIEALLNESLVFERAYSTSPSAIPSHAAWLSSVPPPKHLTVRGTFVADGQTLLPEQLERLGYYRAYIGSNPDVSSERGLAQGLDAIVQTGENGPDDHARAVVDDAIETFRERTGRWFMFVDVDDPQAPYEPARDLLGDVVMPPGGPLAHLTHVWVGRVRLGKLVPTQRELEYVRRLYRGELQMVSGAVGELLEFLRQQRRLDQAIVVLMGVHGEEFAEHGGAGHGTTLYEESLRVPLAIRAPDLVATGRITAAVDLLDVAPTIADLLGLPPSDAWQGQSLVPVIDDPVPPPRLVVAYRGDGSLAAIVGDAKLWLGPGTAERFSDLSRDAGESSDLLTDGGVALRIVRSALAWELAPGETWRRARWGTGANLTAAFALDHGM